MSLITESIKKLTKYFDIPIYDFGAELWNEAIDTATEKFDELIHTNKVEIEEARDGAASLLAKNSEQDYAIAGIVSRMDNVEADAPNQDANIPGRVAVFNFSDVKSVDIKSNDQTNGWEHKTLLGYNSEAVPTGIYLGQFASTALAISSGGVVGDWFFNTADTYWYQITDASAPSSSKITRAGSKHLPLRRAAALVGAGTSQRLIIFDLSSSDITLWMEFSNPVSGLLAGETNVELKWVDQFLFLANSVSGLIKIDFATETVWRLDSVSGYVKYTEGFTKRDTANSSVVIGGEKIPNNSLRSIIAYTPDSASALVDPVTSMALSYLIVSSASKVFVITPSGEIFKSDLATGFTSLAHVSGRLFAVNTSGDPDVLIDFGPIVDLIDGFAAVETWSNATTLPLSSNVIEFVVAANTELLVQTDVGLDVVKPGTGGASASALVRIGSDFNTGLIRSSLLAVGCDTSAVDIADAGTLKDRSGNGLDLTATGSITRAQHITDGLSLLYGFSDSNYLESTAAALDLDGSAFSIGFVMKVGEVSALGTILDAGEAATGKSRSVIITDSGQIGFDINGDQLLSPGELDDDAVHCVVITSNAAGNDVKLYVDSLLASTSTTLTMNSFVYSALRLGLNLADANPFTGKLGLIAVADEAWSISEVGDYSRSALKLFSSGEVTITNPLVTACYDNRLGISRLVADDGAQFKLTNYQVLQEQDLTSSVGVASSSSAQSIHQAYAGSMGIKIYTDLINLNEITLIDLPPPAQKTEVVEDLTPELGGNLDANEKQVQSAILVNCGDGVQNLGSIGGGSVTIDLRLGNVIVGTIDTSETTFVLSNMTTAAINNGITWKLTNAGSQIINFPATAEWPDGTPPTFEATGMTKIVSERDTVRGVWENNLVGQGYA